MDVCCGAKREIAVPKHLSFCWRSIKRGWRDGGGTIQMQMLMTVAEDNHSGSVAAGTGGCGCSDRTHHQRAATCCTSAGTGGDNKDKLRLFEKIHTNVPSFVQKKNHIPPTSASVFQSRVHRGVREEHRCGLNAECKNACCWD